MLIEVNFPTFDCELIPIDLLQETSGICKKSNVMNLIIENNSKLFSKSFSHNFTPLNIFLKKGRWIYKPFSLQDLSVFSYCTPYISPSKKLSIELKKVRVILQNKIL